MSVPLKPFLDQIIVSGSLHVYVSQRSRGELVMGGSTDPYGLYSTRSTLDFKEGLLGHMLELLPMLGEVKILTEGGATVFDVVEWKSTVASRKNDDVGTISFITIDPTLAGFEFVVADKDGTRRLITRDAQHEYVFVEQAGAAKP